MKTSAMSAIALTFRRHTGLLSSVCNRIINSREYCAPAPRPIVADALDAVTRLELHVNRWPHSLGLSYVWLRDHCRCPECYNYVTNQRKQDMQKIPLNIRPASVKTTNDGLEIQWPDGHKTEYEYKFLWQNTYEGRRTSHKRSHRLWNANTFPKENLTTVPLTDIRSPENNGLKRLLSSIVTHGFGFISQVPNNVDETRAAVEEICPVRNTLFGSMWSFQADYKHADTAYSDEYLGAHTDNTYLSEASRIQVFHCLEPATEGGETLLVDGFNVAQQYHDRHPEGYEFLSKTSIPSEYIGDGQHMVCLDTVFKHNPASGDLEQFRYNIYDRAPLTSIPVERMQEFYLHMRNLGKIVRNPKNEYWLKLQPGTLLLIDNWRVMHGRNKYVGSRIMGGCYLDNDGFTSKARTVGVPLD
ncbi:trimethyllysine dioxygenase, mitochondrial [Palaemon carinicauda]|uniref:trimethyllysine dioxygenase, mitochondrial n=1 Tax=Palaemon carinicauda TaxID=392227 RepID=UPI0035B5CD06